MSKAREFDEGFEIYLAPARGQMSPNFALFAAQTMTLCFSSILREKLGIMDWETCLIAYNRQTKEIAIKQCEVEEYGARKFSPVNSQSESRRISIKGMIKFFSAENDTTRKYQPEIRRKGLLILTPVQDE